jgi:hypothetical protein
VCFLAGPGSGPPRDRCWEGGGDTRLGGAARIGSISCPPAKSQVQNPGGELARGRRGRGRWKGVSRRIRGLDACVGTAGVKGHGEGVKADAKGGNLEEILARDLAGVREGDAVG